MIILHYFLGFPPYRSGGLTKYVCDLAKAQCEDGNEVMVLWPGMIVNYSAQPFIREQKKVWGIRNFEIVNPLPVPLDEGIVDIDRFTRECDKEIYLSFLSRINPHVIHIHTLMGLHREFFFAADELNIRTVYTSHDYFGICPKVTLFRDGKCCECDIECKLCSQCNKSALSIRKIQIMQSPLYRFFKESVIVKYARKIHRRRFFQTSDNAEYVQSDIGGDAIRYKELRSYYLQMLELVDFIHFNSTIAENVYKQYINPKNSKVISITHRGIVEHKHTTNKSDKRIILYLAPTKAYKGWEVLNEACNQLYDEGFNFELRVYSSVDKKENYMRVNEEGFSHGEFNRIMGEADVLVAPSMCYETFGFTVLEALSYGVPVIVSDHVGAKDIVGKNGLIVGAGDIEALKNAIKNINVKVSIDIKSWKTFMEENYCIYEDGMESINLD